MSSNSKIEWTDYTWNPVVGCTRASEGCDRCYSVRMTYRLESMGQEKYRGLTVLNGKGDRHFNGVIRCDHDALAIPLKWRKPRRVFVNSMSDLFHEDVPEDFITRVFAICWDCPRHTFQILTKRPDRAAKLTNSRKFWKCVRGWLKGNHLTCVDDGSISDELKVLPNVWLGTSVENQEWADKRIPHLLRCPAAVRFLSCEPLLAPVDFLETPLVREAIESNGEQDPHGSFDFDPWHDSDLSGIHWVIVGGESGPGARPCNIEWIRSIIAQCKAASVACFVKQLGKWIDDGKAGTSEKNPDFCIDRFLFDNGHTWSPPILRSDYNPQAFDQRPLNAIAFGLSDPKGGDPSEWPEDLRVREFPKVMA